MEVRLRIRWEASSEVRRGHQERMEAQVPVRWEAFLEVRQDLQDRMGIQLPAHWVPLAASLGAFLEAQQVGILLATYSVGCFRVP